jgi:hypothetical protein
MSLCRAQTQGEHYRSSLSLKDDHGQNSRVRPVATVALSCSSNRWRVSVSEAVLLSLSITANSAVMYFVYLCTHILLLPSLSPLVFSFKTFPLG